VSEQKDTQFDRAVDVLKSVMIYNQNDKQPQEAPQ